MLFQAYQLFRLDHFTASALMLLLLVLRHRYQVRLNYLTSFSDIYLYTAGGEEQNIYPTPILDVEHISLSLAVIQSSSIYVIVIT